MSIPVKEEGFCFSKVLRCESSQEVMGQSQLAPRCTGRITVNKAVGEICQTIGLVAEASSYAPAALSGSDSPLTRDGHPEERRAEGAGDLLARNLLSPVQCQALETLPVPALCCRTEPGTLGTSTDAYRLIRKRNCYQECWVKSGPRSSLSHDRKNHYLCSYKTLRC